MSIVQKCIYDHFEECYKGFNCQKCSQSPVNRLQDKMLKDESIQDKIIDSNINFFQACISKADQIFLKNMTVSMDSNNSISFPKELNITISVVDSSVANEIGEAFQESINMIGLNKG